MQKLVIFNDDWINTFIAAEASPALNKLCIFLESVHPLPQDDSDDIKLELIMRALKKLERDI